MSVRLSGSRVSALGDEMSSFLYSIMPLNVCWKRDCLHLMSVVISSSRRHCRKWRMHWTRIMIDTNIDFSVDEAVLQQRPLRRMCRCHSLMAELCRDIDTLHDPLIPPCWMKRFTREKMGVCAAIRLQLQIHEINECGQEFPVRFNTLYI